MPAPLCFATSPPQLEAETTSMSTTTHPSWLPWAAIVASILLVHNRLSWRHISASLQKEEEEEAPPLSSSEPFPWEPNNTPISLSGTNLPSSSSPPQERKLQPSTSSAEEQLQFLACMTFANGGLRSPSCPCCQ
eukprot:scaffold161_cov121-Skeletonema_dohrnii-CCMP3373.AAC.3